MTSRNTSFSLPRGDQWLHGRFLNLIHDLVDANNLCWAEVAAGTVSYYLGTRTFRLGVLERVLAAVGLVWRGGSLSQVDQPGDFVVPLTALDVQVDPPKPVQELTVDILVREISARRVIILDWFDTPGHCALVTGFVSSQQGHVAVEVADPGGGKSLVPLAALDTVGWENFRLTRPAKNRGTRGRRSVNWSGIRASIRQGRFLGLNLPTEDIRLWGGVIPVIDDKKVASVVGGANPHWTVERWISRRGGIVRAVDQDAASKQTVQWSAGPWLDDAATKVSTIFDGGERIVAWVDSEALRERGWILEGADRTTRRFEKLARPLGEF